MYLNRGNTWALEYFIYRGFGAQVYNNEVHRYMGPLGDVERATSSKSSTHSGMRCKSKWVQWPISH